MPKFCKQCGAPLQEGVRFCTSCGAQIVEAAQQPQAQPQPQSQPQSQPQPTQSDQQQNPSGNIDWKQFKPRLEVGKPQISYISKGRLIAIAIGIGIVILIVLLSKL